MEENEKDVKRLRSSFRLKKVNKLGLNSCCSLTLRIQHCECGDVFRVTRWMILMNVSEVCAHATESRESLL